MMNLPPTEEKVASLSAVNSAVRVMRGLTRWLHQARRSLFRSMLRSEVPVLFGPDRAVAVFGFGLALVFTVACYWTFNAIIIRCALSALDAPPFDSVVASDTGPPTDMPLNKQACGPEQAWCVFDTTSGTAPSWQTLQAGLSAIHGYKRFTTLIPGKLKESIIVEGHTTDERACAIGVRVVPEDRYANALLASVIGAAPYLTVLAPKSGLDPSGAGATPKDRETTSWELSDGFWTILGLKRLVTNVKLRDRVYVTDDDTGRNYLKRCPDALAKLDRFDAKLNGLIDVLRERVSVQRWLLSTANGWVQWVIVLFSSWCTVLLSWRRWILGVERARRFSARTSFAPGWFHRRLTKGGASATGDEKPIVQVLLSEFRKELENGRLLEGWLADSLPLLGFIGTVLGMIDAMSFVSEVVAAEPGIELATAMGKVTGALAVAFRTTLLSLLFIIPLSRFMSATYAAEDRYLYKVVSDLTSGAEENRGAIA